jgi:hypothetical protein
MPAAIAMQLVLDCALAPLDQNSAAKPVARTQARDRVSRRVTVLARMAAPVANALAIGDRHIAET